MKIQHKIKLAYKREEKVCSFRRQVPENCRAVVPTLHFKGELHLQSVVESTVRSRPM